MPSPLHIAAQQGKLDEVKEQLEANSANVNLREDGRTPLFMAVWNKRLDVARYLLEEKNADPNLACIKCKTTPLCKAATNGDEAIVKLLIKNQADRRKKDMRGRTPETLARKYGYEKVERILRQTPLPTKDALVERSYSMLRRIVDEKRFRDFFPGEAQLRSKADRVAHAALELWELGLSIENIDVLTRLALYDLAILIDDSPSISFEQEGARLVALKKGLKSIAAVYSMLHEGNVLMVRFINSRRKKDNVDKETLAKLLDEHKYNGDSMIGTALEKKIVAPLILKKPLEHPVLIMVITDGDVDGEGKEKIEDVIEECMTKVNNQDAVAFQFSRVGNDPDAERFLKDLDRSRRVGEHVSVETMEWDLDEAISKADRRKKMIQVLVGALNKVAPNEDDEDEED